MPNFQIKSFQLNLTYTSLKMFVKTILLGQQFLLKESHNSVNTCKVHNALRKVELSIKRKMHFQCIKNVAHK